MRRRSLITWYLALVVGAEPREAMKHSATAACYHVAPLKKICRATSLVVERLALLMISEKSRFPPKQTLHAS
jgi:hypothetical protein